MNNAPKVDTSKIKCSKEYVCWIDIMGTKNTMSESFQKAANYILKFHSSVIDIVKDEEGVSYYPLMDGIFITTPNNATIRKIIDKIFSAIGIIFLNEKKHGHRFIIKGSISFGDIAHGKSIDEKICEKLANENDYKRSIMCGLPMIQAFTAEHMLRHLACIYMNLQEIQQIFKANIMAGRLFSVWIEPSYWNVLYHILIGVNTIAIIWRLIL